MKKLTNELFIRAEALIKAWGGVEGKNNEWVVREVASLLYIDQARLKLRLHGHKKRRRKLKRKK